MQHQPRKGQRSAGELRIHLLEVIEVEVAVAARPDEVADPQIALLRDQMREERIGRNVERHAQEDVAAPLVELTGQPTAAAT